MLNLDKDASPLQFSLTMISQRKGGVPGTETPKIQALPEWGGSDPCLDFCEGFVHMH